MAGPKDTLQRPLRDLRISVTDRCNFRCNYCMPAEVFGETYEFLPRSEVLSFEEIERLARIFVDLGARKLRLTGGEPLLRTDLPQLVSRLARIPGLRDLTMTTNAYLLPRFARDIRRAGLHRLTVSLDSLDPAVFGQMAGTARTPDDVLAGIAAAEAVGFRAIKVNCVVRKDTNEHTLVDLARHFRGTGHIVRFIEFMDVGTLNGWDLGRVVGGTEILDIIGSAFPLEPAEPAYRGEVARRWRYTDGGGEIGIITSVSQPFCGDCTRARLTTDGKLVTCLFASGGHDLRAELRGGATDEELRKRVASLWGARTDRYSEERSAATAGLGARPRIEMYRIGG